MNYVKIDYCNRDVEVSFYIEPGDNGDYYQPPSPDTVVVREVCYEGRDITRLINKEKVEEIVSDKYLDMFNCNSDLWRD